MEPTRNFDLLDRYLSLFPDADALAAKSGGKWIKYSAREYNDYARWFALGLLELGFGKGDKIATVTNNRPEWNFTDMGMAMAGVIHVPGCTPMEVTFTNIGSSGAAFSYLWEFSDGTTSNEYEPIHVYMEPGIFDVSLEVWTEEGCHDKFVKEEAVEVDQAGGISYPTGFRPGNEPTGGHVDPAAPEYERNKVFAPGLSEKVDEYHLMIYNRWGELLFESYDINVGWDGFVRGVKAKQDVYIWKIRGKYTNGESFVMAGDITLLR